MCGRRFVGRCLSKRAHSTLAGLIGCGGWVFPGFHPGLPIFNPCGIVTAAGLFSAWGAAATGARGNREPRQPGTAATGARGNRVKETAALISQTPRLIKAPGVQVDDLLPPGAASPRCGGLAGKLTKVFEEVSALPLRQQDKVVECVFAVIPKYRQGQKE